MNDKNEVLELLNKVKEGKVSPQDALFSLQKAPFEDLGYAKIDYHRGLRQGIAEVIYGQHKTPEQILGIVSHMISNGLGNILITRISPQVADFLKANNIDIDYHSDAALGVVSPVKKEGVGLVVIASAGTSDISVSEEAALTAETLGSKVERIYDVGVSGLHRLLAHMEILTKARAIVAVAGMEGALSSVIGGLVSCPVIAVPTSVGYGASFGGLAPLLAMLNSCAAGVSVVNIDNGFGAGFLANRINQQVGSGK
ncbi:MAG: nickel pincer cofactor biosynthesis protein LarB [Elusimicrobiota bacterium]|nr:nickel pincer cofactor biosynthesis protein LarB [Elusimicrobiota bacterium]